MRLKDADLLLRKECEWFHRHKHAAGDILIYNFDKGVWVHGKKIDIRRKPIEAFWKHSKTPAYIARRCPTHPKQRLEIGTYRCFGYVVDKCICPQCEYSTCMFLLTDDNSRDEW